MMLKNLKACELLHNQSEKNLRKNIYKQNKLSVNENWSAKLINKITNERSTCIHRYQQKVHYFN